MSKALFAALLFFFLLPAQAASGSEALSTCFADHTSGKQRKDLARWIFVAMSSHPEISDISHVSSQERDKSNRTMATLVMRLLTEDCTAETKAAMRDGSEGVSSSFKVLG